MRVVLRHWALETSSAPQLLGYSKFGTVVVEVALFHEGLPLPSLLRIVRKLLRKGKRHDDRYFRLSSLECRLDGLAKRGAAELELATQYPEVVEVLHARIDHTELHEGL